MFLIPAKKTTTIKYPLWIREVITTLFMIINRGSPYLPQEIWFYILQMINNNNLGRKHKHHLNSFCERCRYYHGYDEAFILNIFP